MKKAFLAFCVFAGACGVLGFILPLLAGTPIGDCFVYCGGTILFVSFAGAIAFCIAKILDF